MFGFFVFVFDFVLCFGFGIFRDNNDSNRVDVQRGSSFVGRVGSEVVRVGV